MAVAPVHTTVFGNTWAGRLINEHLDELYQYNARVDTGFFSEVLSYESESAEALISYGLPGNGSDRVTVNQLQLIERYLHDFVCVHAAKRTHEVTCMRSGRHFPSVGFGNVRCFRGSLPVIDHGSVPVYGTSGEKDNQGVNPRGLDYVVLGGSERTILAHLHGLWIAGNTKGDAPERDEQSERVRRALRILGEQHGTDRIILGGDFNLDLNTRALRHLEEGDSAEDTPLRNLIRERGITSTRTPHYRHYGEPDVSLYADYILVSEAIEVVELTLRPDSASDHMHLLLGWR